MAPTRLHGLTLRVLLAAASSGCAAADAEVDWLVTAPAATASVTTSGSMLTIANGLVSRTFALAPAFGTIDFEVNATSGRGGRQRWAEWSLLLVTAAFSPHPSCYCCRLNEPPALACAACSGP